MFGNDTAPPTAEFAVSLIAIYLRIVLLIMVTFFGLGKIDGVYGMGFYIISKS
jgi:hypothetical protein